MSADIPDQTGGVARPDDSTRDPTADAGVDTADADGWTALGYACDNGHANAIGMLLEAGASVDFTTADGWTPLMIASRDGHSERVLQTILDGGANVNMRTSEGWTALMFAAREVSDGCLP